MKREAIVFVFLFVWGGTLLGAEKSLKLLHLSFHIGCNNDFDEVAKELNFEVTNWVPSDQVHFLGEHVGNALYNISQERGKQIWLRHEDYFNQFDVIMTSDTSRLARIFLENGWQKPLIIWICNRFDYCDAGTARQYGLPDQAFLDTMRAAINKSNVKIISYTPYEHHYAHKRNVLIPQRTIKPLGHLPRSFENGSSAIPTSIQKGETIFLYPRQSPKQSDYIITACRGMGLSIYSGVYKGPEDLSDFKAVIYFPYQASNFALFENIQQGIIHFVPSEKFIENHRRHVRSFTWGSFELCEWYAPENRALFVYFDSWDDLKQKVTTLDYNAMHAQVISRARQHRADTLIQWRTVFNELIQDNY